MQRLLVLFSLVIYWTLSMEVELKNTVEYEFDPIHPPKDVSECEVCFELIYEGDEVRLCAGSTPDRPRMICMTCNPDGLPAEGIAHDGNKVEVLLPQMPQLAIAS